MLPGARDLGAQAWSTPSAAVLRAVASAAKVKATIAATTSAGAASEATPESTPQAVTESEEPASYVCPYTNKRFKSRGAFESYLLSKRYKALVAKAGPKPLRADSVEAAHAARQPCETGGGSMTSPVSSAGASIAERVDASSGGGCHHKCTCVQRPTHGEAQAIVERAAPEMAAGRQEAAAGRCRLHERASNDTDASDDEWEDADEPWCTRARLPPEITQNCFRHCCAPSVVG